MPTIRLARFDVAWRGRALHRIECRLNCGVPCAQDEQGHACDATSIVPGAGPGSIPDWPALPDPDPSSTHKGETQEERILQFMEENEEPVIGLREGSMLRVEAGAVILKGSNMARIFRRGEEPAEVSPGSDLSAVSGEPACISGTHL